MVKTMISVALALGVTVPATARQFSAADVPNRKLAQSGTIVISNDGTAIRATHVVGKRKSTLVEVRSVRRAPVVAAAAAAPPARAARASRAPESLAGIFEEAAQRYSLDPLLITAVARQESRFRPDAVSPVGARGVMQLMPKTAAWLGVTDSFDARQNIFGGAKYLKMLLDQFKGDVDLSLAAYNAGPGAVRKYRGIPPYRETTAYVAAIRRDYQASRRNNS